MVDGYVAGRQPLAARDPVVGRRDRPGVQGPRLPEGPRPRSGQGHRARPLVRRLPRQPARLVRGLRQGDRRRRPALARRPGPPRPGRPADRGGRPERRREGARSSRAWAATRSAASAPTRRRSAATATTTGRGMLLGNPHFPWRGRYRFTQQHLTIPGKYDVAGALARSARPWSTSAGTRTSRGATPCRRPTASRRTSTTSPARTTYLTDGRPAAARAPRGQRHGAPGRRLARHGQRGPVPDQEGYVVDAPATLMLWTAASVWAIRDANAEHLRTVDTFLEMGKATRRARPAAPPGRGRRACRGSTPPPPTATATCSTPTTRWSRTCPTTMAAAVHDARSAGCSNQVAGLPGLDGTRAGVRLHVGHRRGRLPARHLRARQPARRPSAATGSINANDSYWLPNPDRPARGLRRGSSAASSASGRCAPGWSTATSRPAAAGRHGQGVARAALRGHEHENRLHGRRGDARRRRPRQGLRRHRRDPRPAPSWRTWDGRSDAALGRHPHLRGVRGAAARQARVAGAVRRRPTRSTRRAT